MLTAALATACPTGPVDWSRDGLWIAWTAVELPDSPALPRGWLRSPLGDEPPPASGRNSHRIWATRFPSLESALILDSPHPLSSPCWSADGRSMAYARFVSSDPARDGVQRGRFEVVIRSGLDRERSVVIDPGLALDAEGRKSLAASRPALGPDGRRVVVPRPGRESGLWLVLLDDSGAVMTLEDAVAPAWSPDGRRLAFLKVRPGPAGPPVVSLHVSPPAARLDGPLGIENALTPDFLAWAPDGRSLLAIANPMRGPFRSTQLDLVRIGLDGGPAGRPSNLESTPPANANRRLQGQVGMADPGKPPSLRIELSMDAGQEEGVCLVETNGREQILRWGNLLTQNTFKRFHPLDPGLRIDAPALAPDGRTAAFRVDDGTGAGLLALIDLNTEELSLVAPDEATRRRWLDRLADCALSHLLEWIPGEEVASARPTVLPILAELGGLHQRRYTLSRLARFASPLLKERAGEGPDGLDEFRLFFSYLNQDYASASRWLDAVEAGTDDPEALLRWLGLRAQIFLGDGQVEKARGIIDYLARETRRPSLSVEETAGGYKLSGEPLPDAAWVDHLRQKSSDLAAQRIRPGRGDRVDGGEPVDPFSDFEAGGPDPIPNIPFAPPPGVVPIVPDEFNPPGLRPRNLMVPPAPDGRPVAPLLPRAGGLRLEVEE
ncbi:MAG: hypothetical protein BGO49_09305 [Planctomycetales bacterium 71-10]|nr:MAG: hypothetical protein BGO49_09305 [Planctomycetales bacterium 71-10]